MDRIKLSSFAAMLLALVLVSSWSSASARPVVAQPAMSTLVAIRAASHTRTAPRFDRVVFEFRGPVPLIDVQYVNRLIGDGSGLPVRITGNAIVQVRMSPAQAHTEQGQPTAPARLAPRLPNVKEIARSGDFEGVVTYGIGLARKSEIRVITLDNPSRVVVDILHP